MLRTTCQRDEDPEGNRLRKPWPRGRCLDFRMRHDTFTYDGLALEMLDNYFGRLLPAEDLLAIVPDASGGSKLNRT